MEQHADHLNNSNCLRSYSLSPPNTPSQQQYFPEKSNHSVLIKMSTYVSIGWIPLVKDADSNSAVASLKGLKDQKLATPGLEHAYHGTPTDPNEPKAAEIIDGEFPLRTVQLLFTGH